MNARLVSAIAGALVLAFLGAGEVAAQQPAPPLPQYPAPGAAQYPAGQLDQMLAPIALYPDTLLSQVLMAATYPLEVVEADRWLQQPGNTALKGQQLAAALDPQPWDPSVKSLIPFPQVLRMMDANLGWTERLGEAFLADQAGVMDSVQRLRQRAQAAGKLGSTPQQVVRTQDSAIVIDPPGPETVYVPVYDPFVAYGPWPYPDFPPYYFPGFFPGVFIGGFGFGWFGASIFFPLWGWDHWDWHGHHIDIDRDRYAALNGHRAPSGNVWEHDPDHRRGVPYRNSALRQRFAGNRAAPEAQRAVRGYASGAAPQVVRPSPGAGRPSALPPLRAPAAARQPPAFESFGRGPEVRAQAQRGGQSRIATPSFAPARRPADARGATRVFGRPRRGRRAQMSRSNIRRQQYEDAMTSQNRTGPWASWRLRLIGLVLLLAVPASSAFAASQKIFASPEQAADALAAAWQSGERGALLAIFGPAGEKLVSSGDRVADNDARQRLAAAYAEQHQLEADGPDKATIILGKDEWPYPIPLVRQGSGWRFDLAAGAEQIIDRRIGRNELNAIEVCRTYVDAQRDYAANDTLGGGLHEYAMKVGSSDGKHDGLYWPASQAAEESPLGPLVAAAEAQGYPPPAAEVLTPFHGYLYRILTRQGKNAPGGARDYVVNGHLTGGFALIAFPAKYGDAGVMTFVVNQDGIVFQKNLGRDTARIARRVTEYDPDNTWTIAQP